MSEITRLDTALDRILTKMRNQGAYLLPAPNRACTRCDDRGVVLLETGEYRTWGSTARGEGRLVDARTSSTALGCSCRATTSTIKRREF